MTYDHKCTHGVGPEYDGSLRWYYEEDVKYSDPIRDVIFDFCPFCGKQLHVTTANCEEIE